MGMRNIQISHLTRFTRASHATQTLPLSLLGIRAKFSDDRTRVAKLGRTGSAYAITSLILSRHKIGCSLHLSKYALVSAV